MAVLHLRSALAALLVCALVYPLVGCSSPGPGETPEETIRAIRETIMEGRADRLGDFIYADDPEMRRLLKRVGVFLGNLQKLGASVQARFPDEVSALRAQAEAAAKEGRATSFLSQMMLQREGRRRRPSAEQAEQAGRARSAFDEFMKSLLADPYGWVEKAEERLTTEFLTDDSVAMLWDGKPILPPLGMTMRRGEDDLWYVVLPTGAPGVSNFMPRTKEQYQIFGSLVATFDNVVIDLRKEVEEGRVGNLEELSRKAGEKAFLPVAAVVFAYEKYNAEMRKQGEGK
jgi:hypothetical protein